MLRGLPRLQCNFFCVWLELRRLPQYTVRQGRRWFKNMREGGWGAGFQSSPVVFETKSRIHPSTRTPNAHEHVQTRRTRRRGGGWGYACLPPCVGLGLTPKPALLTFVNFGCVHPSAPTRMLADTALAVHDRGCSLQGPSHGLSDLAVPASGAACPSQWQLASFVIMMPAPAASE